MANVYAMLILIIVGLFLIIMPQKTMQLTMDHPLNNIVQSLNEKEGPFLGLVISSNRDEKFLLNSNFFVSNPSTPFIRIAGRTFNIGKFNNVPAIYVFAGEQLVNAAVTVQLLIDTFKLRGIIHYGGAASVSSKLPVTDVIVPYAVAYYGIWTWKKWEPSTSPTPPTADPNPHLKIGDFNANGPGDNYLGTIQYEPVELYTLTKPRNTTYSIFVHPEWVRVASQMGKFEGFNVLVGAGIASSDVYLFNEAYAKTIGDDYRCQDGNACTRISVGADLGFKAVDTQSAAIVSTALANGVPHIVIRGASNTPGTPKDEHMADVTAANVLKVVTKFIELINPSSKSDA